MSIVYVRFGVAMYGLSLASMEQVGELRAKLEEVARTAHPSFDVDVDVDVDVEEHAGSPEPVPAASHAQESGEPPAV